MRSRLYRLGAAVTFAWLNACVPPTYAEPIEEKGATEEEPVVVTGSNIGGSSSPEWVPESIYNREAIERTGARTLSDFMRELPQNSGPTFTENQNDSLAAGGSAVALRGLSPDATLVLLNGRRVAPYPFAQNGITAFVDLNSFPLAAIQQVDVLRDGASAIYGSDAIAGVVNVRYLPNYDGLLLGFGYGNTTDTDTGEYRTHLITGFTDEKRGIETVLVVDHFDRNALFSTDRFFSRSIDQRPRGGSSFLSSVANPGTVFDPVTGDPLRVPPDSDGTPAVGEFLPGRNRFDRAPFQPLVPETERSGVYGRAQVRILEGLDFFTEFGYRNVFTKQQLAPAPIEGDVENISVPASNPFNPFGTDVVFRYRVTEAGPRVDEVTSDVYHTVAGFKLQLPARWRLESAFLYSETDTEDKTFNNLRRSAVLAALADTNPATSFNVFGTGDNVNNPGTIDALRVTTTRDGQARIFGGDAKADGPLLKLPGGDVFAAAGIEYRYEDLEDQFDPLVTSGGVIDVNSTSASGHRDVISGFGELYIPIVSPDLQIPGLNSLDVQVAFRAEGYSDFGSVVNPKVGLAWRPVPDWGLLRFAYGTGFRAPSLVQLYTGSLTFSQQLRDTTRFAVTGSPEDESSSLQILAGGNSELGPEDSENFSAGFVLTPPTIPGLTLSMDFFRIKVDGSIAALDPQFILDNESDFPGFVMRAPPSAMDQALGIPGEVLLINTSFQNLGFVKVKGFDASAEYVTPKTSIGVFIFRFDGAYIGSFEQQASAAEPVRELAGTFNRPQFRCRVSGGWRIAGFEAITTLNYIDSFEDFQDDGTVDDSTSIDVVLQYRFASPRPTPSRARTDSKEIVSGKEVVAGKDVPVTSGSGARVNRWLDGLALRFGVRNVFDDPPPFSNNPFGYAVALEDPRQRFVFFDIEKKF